MTLYLQKLQKHPTCSFFFFGNYTHFVRTSSHSAHKYFIFCIWFTNKTPKKNRHNTWNVNVICANKCIYISGMSILEWMQGNVVNGWSIISWLIFFIRSSEMHRNWTSLCTRHPTDRPTMLEVVVMLNNSNQTNHRQPHRHLFHFGSFLKCDRRQPTAAECSALKPLFLWTMIVGRWVVLARVCVRAASIDVFFPMITLHHWRSSVEEQLLS